MNTILTSLMIIALGATIVILILGIVNMFRENPGQEKRSNKLMQWRVLAQGAALILFTLILLLGRKST
ncbi:MAG: twin transmembrane helix small protein [Janthinobacterium lividum]